MVFEIITGLLLIGMSVAMILGKGSFFIAGYKRMLKDKKSSYDKEALSKFIGKIVLPMGIIMLFSPIAEKYSISCYPAVRLYVIFALYMFALIYANTGNRFKK